ncbi:MAG: glycosyltransferase family 4 protein [Clostridia bacterium]|nr:glycosyltransferase family 4 protein [Clostridia bacterium]
MKVLHVISDENIGGAGVLLTNLLRNFDPCRVQSVVALPRESKLMPRIQELGIPTVELEYPCDRFSRASFRELREIVKNTNPDLIHANAALSARLVGKRLGKKVIHTRHCCFPPTGIWKNRGMRYVGGLWNRRLSDHVIATADAAAEDLRRLGIPREQISVIINGSERIREVLETELDFYRDKWRLQKDDFLIGICARLERCKGQDVFLKAAKRLIGRLPHAKLRFLIVGSGTQENALKALAKDLGIGDRVCFTGFVADMAPVYRLLRVNVNCSVGTETSCLALSEGMSASLPMVVSHYGGNGAMVGDGKAGILFPPGDDGALADALERIISDPSLELTMRNAAYERYEQQYTAVQMTERLTAVYERLFNET